MSNRPTSTSIQDLWDHKLSLNVKDAFEQHNNGMRLNNKSKVEDQKEQKDE